ncbi:hypothetical protein TRIATDRAFT_42334 [Trichoderma atroviride IMI 206040]|uniref:Uncharacterized protein n=1 Tax=Hypocrea atroviridis (strain ATCC 20476 / IMI 206040) TaxID=452589 RepID=G9P9E4_HYPAI|nr:uncharacterized protein TRIATDRAFT_42334 [Trichoderma atroviride IMI 206040]EHK40271.1 hypothetical protein TRIATDRAFT_42334 [Trichoderma atroviride IMI 206040]
MEEEATESCETGRQRDKSLEPDEDAQLQPPVPRRVQELRNPKSRPRKSIKSRARERLAKELQRSPSPPRWRVEVVSALESGQSFSAHVKILRILDRIPELRDHVPQIVSSNAKLRTYTIRYTRCELVGFECEARRSRFSYKKILGFKHQLYGFVKLMYQSGVRYNIYPGNILIYKSVRRESTRHLMFLGSVQDCSDLVDATTEPDWSEYRKYVWEHIHRVFALLEIWTYQEEAVDLIAAVDREKDLVESLIEGNIAVIDDTRGDVDEARTIMAETVEVFNKTLANIKHLKALSDGFMASAKGPILIWEDAQSRKEVVEKNMKKIEVLGHRTNALIEKYRDPSKPEDEASELEIALEQLGDEEESTEPNTEVIDLFVDGAEAEEVVIWDEGLPIQDGEETVQEEEVVVYEETVQEEEVVVYEDATAQDEAVAGDIGSEEEDSSE